MLLYLEHYYIKEKCWKYTINNNILAIKKLAGIFKKNSSVQIKSY